MKPYLTDEEIADVTAPLTQGAARCKLLERMGLKVEPRANGQPLVGRAHFEAVMGARAGEAANDSPAKGDWTEFDKRVRCGRGPKAQRRQPAGA